MTSQLGPDPTVVTRLEKDLDRQRAYSSRALRSLHAAMSADLARAVHRAEVAERRLEQTERRLRKAVRRADASQRRLADAKRRGALFRIRVLASRVEILRRIAGVLLRHR